MEKMLIFTSLFSVIIIVLINGITTAGFSSCTDLHLLMIHGTYGLMSYQYNAPAIDIAVEEIRRRVTEGEYVNISLTLEDVTIRCFGGERQAGAIFAETYFKRPLAAIMGPPCSHQMHSVAELAGAWDVPVLSGLSSSRDLENEAIYSTLTRTTQIIASGYAYAIVEVLRHFGWGVASVIWDGGKNYWSLIEEAATRELDRIELDYHDFSMRAISDNFLALLNASKVGRSKKFDFICFLSCPDMSCCPSRNPPPHYGSCCYPVWRSTIRDRATLIWRCSVAAGLTINWAKRISIFSLT